MIMRVLCTSPEIVIVIIHPRGPICLRSVRSRCRAAVFWILRWLSRLKARCSTSSRIWHESERDGRCRKRRIRIACLSLPSTNDNEVESNSNDHYFLQDRVQGSEYGNNEYDGAYDSCQRIDNLRLNALADEDNEGSHSVECARLCHCSNNLLQPTLSGLRFCAAVSIFTVGTVNTPQAVYD